MAKSIKGPFSGHAGQLAFLVNESRSRRPDLSGDPYSSAWVRPQLRSKVSQLWHEYETVVYPYDDIVLSVRNQYFLSAIDSEVGDDVVVVVAPCGFTSYPYLARGSKAFIECDLKEVIDYKQLRASSLIGGGELPEADVKYEVVDFRISDSIGRIINGLSPLCRWVFVLEGISYYLSPTEWASICSEICARARPGDSLHFDYWSERDGRNDVYSRFLKFCRRHAGCSIESFTFLSEREIGSTFKGHRVILSDVIQEEVIQCGTTILSRKRDILRDRYVAILFR